MNCVECEKCKTYGKMQVEGLGTAFKLLIDDKLDTDSGLRRNELIVSFFGLLNPIGFD